MANMMISCCYDGTGGRGGRCSARNGDNHADCRDVRADDCNALEVDDDDVPTGTVETSGLHGQLSKGRRTDISKATAGGRARKRCL